MSEKVVLTQEQADAINGLREECRESDLLVQAKKDWRSKEFLPLNEMELEDFVKALYIGYEIEKPKFQTGDKIILWGRVATLEKLSSNDIAPAWKIDGVDGLNVYESELIRATEEEIYWMDELKRDKVGDFWHGDILLYEHTEPRCITEPHDFDYAKADYEAGLTKGIYPAESFKAFNWKE